MQMTELDRQQKIDILKQFPAQLRSLVSALPEKRLLATPLEDEWSIAQIVHHCADSHINGFARLKLIVTEDFPILKPYLEAEWGNMADANNSNIDLSLHILDGIHPRFVLVLESLTEEQWQRSGNHLDNGVESVDALLDSYAAHCLSHLSQIRRTLAAQPNRLERKVRSFHLALAKKTTAMIDNIVSQVTQEAASTYRDGPEGWSTLEVIGHLHDGNIIFKQRVEAILENEGTVLQSFDHEGLVIENRYQERQLSDLMVDFQQSRVAIIGMFEALVDSAELMARAGIHPENGTWTVTDSLIQLGHHDATHIEQITRILAEKQTA